MYVSTILTPCMAAALVLASCQDGRSQNLATSHAASAEAHPSTPPLEQKTAAPTAGVNSWTFDDGGAGGGHGGWTPGESNGAGTPATWATVARADAPSPPNVYGVTASANYGHTFNLTLADGTSFQDVDLTVAVLATAGAEDQGGGPVWRAADANNYYVTRWNPLEENLRVYFVKDGRRKQLATADATADTTRWHTIRVVHRGSHIECYLDGEKRLEVDDTTFPGAGQVGLWTKADAATLFDDLRVESAR